jgi:hypothetical protein
MKKIDINHSSLSSAFQHVKENHGCAGVDGVTIERFEENLDLNLARLQHELEKQIYFPRPLMKILVEKKNGEANLPKPPPPSRILYTGCSTVCLSAYLKEICLTRWWQEFLRS